MQQAELTQRSRKIDGDNFRAGPHKKEKDFNDLLNLNKKLLFYDRWILNFACVLCAACSHTRFFLLRIMSAFYGTLDEDDLSNLWWRHDVYSNLDWQFLLESDSSNLPLFVSNPYSIIKDYCYPLLSLDRVRNWIRPGSICVFRQQLKGFSDNDSNNKIA